VNSGCCTWLELAAELARQAAVEPRFVPVRMADVPLRAPRPQFCALSNSKLLGSGVTMPTWQDAVRRFVMAEQLGARSATEHKST
jgi:dTDP-4-dehydrorhamnose reductase